MAGPALASLALLASLAPARACNPTLQRFAGKWFPTYSSNISSQLWLSAYKSKRTTNKAVQYQEDSKLILFKQSKWNEKLRTDRILTNFRQV